MSVRSPESSCLPTVRWRTETKSSRLRVPKTIEFLCTLSASVASVIGTWSKELPRMAEAHIFWSTTWRNSSHLSFRPSKTLVANASRALSQRKGSTKLCRYSRMKSTESTSGSRRSNLKVSSCHFSAIKTSKKNSSPRELSIILTFRSSIKVAVSSCTSSRISSSRNHQSKTESAWRLNMVCWEKELASTWRLSRSHKKANKLLSPS